MKSTAPRPVLHVYLADLDISSTPSLGIYQVARHWLAELVRQSGVGRDVVVSVKPSERDRLLPSPLPDWIQVVEIDGPRLWLDHVWCPWFTRRCGADEILFPKGWVPYLLPQEVHVIAVLHDCMHDFYREQYPATISKLKTSYLRAMTRNTLSRADSVFTISKFSRDQFKSRYANAERMEIIPLGDPLPLPSATRVSRQGLLVFGSKFPHKFTAGTLSLLRQWRRKTGFDETVYVVGQAPISLEPGEVQLGILSDQEVSSRLAGVRALVHLSEMEGFGLPLLESYRRGTPVVYRQDHAFEEVMIGVVEGGVCEISLSEFTQQMERILNLPPERVMEIAQGLESRYNWYTSLSTMLGNAVGLYGG